MHPFVKILCFVLIMFLTNILRDQWLIALCVSLCIMATCLNKRFFFRIVRRMRWLFISLIIIYALSTPGEYIPELLAYASPTYEGFVLGLMQITKLLIALASLSLLFASSSKQDLIAGLYMLLTPLKFVGLNVERFSARLMLTLDYVEVFAVDVNHKVSFKHLEAIHMAANDEPVSSILALQLPEFNRSDKWIIFTIIIFSVILIAWFLFP
jgi:energy-coupling factor transport system permease protein